MWLFTQGGFFSIVEHRDNLDLLIVRSRVKGDIERYWPKAMVHEGGGSDYRFRTILPRSEVADKIAMITNEINYPDFKASITDKRRLNRYFDVWEAMATLQHELHYTEIAVNESKDIS